MKMLLNPNKNPGVSYDVINTKLLNTTVNYSAVNDYVKSLCCRRGKDKNCQIASLLRAVTCIDLTTLCGDDAPSNVHRLCCKAMFPIHEEILLGIGLNPSDVRVGAVCVYPAKVSDCAKMLKCAKDEEATIPIAAVATGFPTGQYHLHTRLHEITACVNDGADEIDIVIRRDLALCEKWKELFEEVKQMREACGPSVKLKTILAAGELGSFTNVYKASMICMAAGADFIKTSTGKESVNATLPIGAVMTRAIKDYHSLTGYKVGFKPAGGIRTAKDVLNWQELMEDQLGKEWLFPDLFRIGASSLLGEIEKTIFKLVTGHTAPSYMFQYQ
ncbi:deoxyribose-phosphate aldolase-like [Uloborus diversus]|uniref:deoxyribose-phosphate aldolase-like n=1 Tax=Uloborus diversus TaxID=327109 RepID=UPI00240A537B|nr:deoxyribose-phosphate aldolase-like [Uloborus diversus]